MTFNRLFGKLVLSKCFSEMHSEIGAVLLSLFFNVAEQKGYLETYSEHADAIHWHLQHVDFDYFRTCLRDFFSKMLCLVRKLGLGKIAIAFDETYIPYYGKEWSIWIHAYKNKVKGATGSFKFMVCSVVLADKRLVLFALPIIRGESAAELVDLMLTEIQKKLCVGLVLCDRGFFSEQTISNLEQKKVQYIVLTPQNQKIKKYMEAKELEVCTQIKSNRDKTTYRTDVRYVFAYGIKDHNWVFATNVRMNPLAMVLTYTGRWGIETTFRVLDQAEIKSKSTNIVARAFFFMIAVLLYNLWIQVRDKLGIGFSTFLDACALAGKTLPELIEGWRKAKEIVDPLAIFE